MELWKSASGEKKTKGTEALQHACKHHFAEMFGAERTAELKALKESGASTDDMAKKVNGQSRDCLEMQ